jgi:3',5'-cyclic AMP phosphodiesterase CpdA
MVIDCISDLHGYLPKLDGGDLLIVAGDLTARDLPEEVDAFYLWLEAQDYKKKIFIAGNHDNSLEDIEPYKSQIDARIEYLCDSGAEFVYYPPLDLDKPVGFRQKLKIWGSPWTRSFKGECPDCLAFTKSTEAELAEKWALIPGDTDILVTHSPPYGIMDEVKDHWAGKIENVGNKSLAAAIWRVKPKLCIFGHIHEGYGKLKQDYGDHGAKHSTSITHVNASYVDEHYHPVNQPIRIEI